MTSTRSLLTIENLVDRHPDLQECFDEIVSAVDVLTDTVRAGGKLLVCGNGGSSAEAAHLVGDLMKSFCRPRPLDQAARQSLRDTGARGERIGNAIELAIPALSLSADSVLMTAIGNDIGYEMVYAQQVHALAKPDDTLIVVTTSGRSPNVINAAHVAKALQISVIAITGRDPGELSSLVDVAIRAPADTVDTIQDLHAPICHGLAHALEAEFFGDRSSEPDTVD